MRYLITTAYLLFSLLMPQQPTSKMYVAVLYHNIFGDEVGIGPNHTIVILQNGKIISKGTTNSLSFHNFELPTGTYDIAMFDNPNLDCFGTHTLTQPQEYVIIHCKHVFWFPFLINQ